MRFWRLNFSVFMFPLFSLVTLGFEPMTTVHESSIESFAFTNRLTKQLPKGGGGYIIKYEKRGVSTNSKKHLCTWRHLWTIPLNCLNINCLNLEHIFRGYLNVNIKHYVSDWFFCINISGPRNITSLILKNLIVNLIIQHSLLLP